MRYLSAPELELALPMSAAMEAVEAVFADAARGRTIAPDRGVVRQSLDGGRESLLLTMPAAWKGRGVGAKVSSFIGDNPAHGRPAVQGIAVLFDTATGVPQLITDAAVLTRRRTAAMVGVATKYLARRQAATLGIVGTGALAADMIEAVRAVRPVDCVVAFNRTAPKAHALAEKCPCPMRVAQSAAAAAAGADILVVATSTSQPVVPDAAIRPGTHINAVGNFSPRGSELEGATVARSGIYVDSYEGALSEAGEILLAADAGLIAAGKQGIRGDLGELVSGAATARRDPEELTLFKSVGTALADVAALWAALQQADRQALGSVLS